MLGAVLGNALQSQQHRLKHCFGQFIGGTLQLHGELSTRLFIDDCAMQMLLQAQQSRLRKRRDACADDIVAMRCLISVTRCRKARNFP